MPEDVDSEQSNRLWAYRLHIESILYSRLAFFLAFETILLGVVGTLYNKADASRIVLIILIVLGGLITLIWLYVQHNMKQIFVVLDKRVYDNFPEHKESVDRILSIRRVESRLGMRTPALMLLTYVVPILILLVWISLLVIL